MTQNLTLANAKLILADEVVAGAVHIKDGMIADVSQGTGIPKGAIDLEGDYLSPGLVELHTDNLERHLSPRPRVNWPHRAAILAHDRELAGCGITTVFDAIRVGSIMSSETSQMNRYARALADELLLMRDSDALKISHHLHLRSEICSETLLEELEEFGPEDRIGIVSMMDHTPGQRQFSDLAKYKAYVCGKHGLDERAFDAHVAFLSALRSKLGDTHEDATVMAAKRYGASLASHDDTTAVQVESSRAHGVTIAEFPTTLDAALACHAHGIATIMGAPNIVRGGSHSGNVSAMALAKAGLLDILSSDYVPSGLLSAAIMLHAEWDNLPRAIATVTKNPAAAVGLHDRGVIAQGLRADLMCFRLNKGDVMVQSVWSLGRQVS